MGELEECGWKKAEEKKEAEVCTIIIMKRGLHNNYRGERFAR